MPRRGSLHDDATHEVCLDEAAGMMTRVIAVVSQCQRDGFLAQDAAIVTSGVINPQTNGVRLGLRKNLSKKSKKHLTELGHCAILVLCTGKTRAGG
jgi:hypothetical protein